MECALEVQEAEIGGVVSVIEEQDKEAESHFAALNLLPREVAFDGLQPLEFLSAAAHELLVARVVVHLVLVEAAVAREVLASSTVQGCRAIHDLLTDFAKGFIYQLVLLHALLTPLL